jgi:hypothetical protein
MSLITYQTKELTLDFSKAHVSILTNSMFEAGCSSKDPQNLCTDKSTLTVDDYMDLDNTMVKYASNNMFGDLL